MNDNPFDFLNSINVSKKNLIREDGRGASEYSPFLMNKGLSQFSDTIMFSNEMNTRGHMDKQMQYEFLLHSLRPRKRMSKWAKKENLEEVDAISNIFNCSMKKSEEMRNTLGAKAIKEILARGEKMYGGSSK